MGRSFDSRVAAFAVGAPDKWVDNLLSHYDLPGIPRGRQGVGRQIPFEGVLAIDIAHILTRELRCPLALAATIAGAVVEDAETSELRYTLPSGTTLLFPRQRLEASLRERLIEAVESSGRARRGRPPSRSSPRLPRRLDRAE